MTVPAIMTASLPARDALINPEPAIEIICTSPDNIAASAVEDPDRTSGLTSKPCFLKYPPSTPAKTGVFDGVMETRPTYRLREV